MAGDSEKTMKNWSKIIESYREIPDYFKDTFQTLPFKGGGFPYTILTPSNLGFFNKEKPKLVCGFNHSLYIFEEIKGDISVTCFHAKDINYIEVGTTLLRSWIRINGMTSNGPKSSVFPSNTVSLKYYMPIIEALRTNSNNFDNTDLETERNKFDYLRKLNYEFLNYARWSILPGEKVFCTVMQPEVQTKMKLFNILETPLFRIVLPAYLTILTNLELIIIKVGQQNLKDNPLRVIRNYVPLKKIKSLLLAEQKENIFSLTIGLPENDTVCLNFATTNKPAVDILINRLSIAINVPANSSLPY